MALGMVSLTLGGADRVAFAVYSADDGTLNFYKRMDVPAKGSTFEGKTVTEIYMGFETDRYGAMNSSNYIPWKTVADRVRSAKVVDDGIAPVSVAHWFDYFDNLSSCDLGNLDFDNVESMNGLFYQCYSLTSLTLPQTDFSSVTNMFATFHGCNALSFDCSGWNVTVSINHGSFNLYAPGVILPKPWQPTAFAVFSSDDGSLNFYKREFKDMPSAEDAFDGKTVTSVYTGFEEDAYTGTWSDDDCPWFNIATKVKSVTVVDTIRPKSMAWWFNQFTTCTSFDIGNVDTSKCVSLERLFSSCGSVVTANLRGLGKWNTGNVQHMDACFDGMDRLIEVPGISSWDTASCISFSSVFYNCSGLKYVDISHWSNKSCKPGPQSWGYVPFGHTGGGYPNLEYVKIGSGWDHVGDLLRNTSTLMKVTGADGNWYALSDGNAYSSSSVPDNKADMYYTTKALLDHAKTPTAFAVYSDDDHSLDFYKRPCYLMPVSESLFEGKAATAVYTGFETASYGKKEGSDSYIPWVSVAGSVLSAEIVDDGIVPVSIAHWFDYFYDLRTCNLGKLNVANVASMDGTFFYNYALSSLTMPTSEFSSLVNMGSAFTCCYALKSVDLSKVNFPNITNLAWAFTGCNSLVLDCSDWDVSNVTSYEHFNNDAPNVTLPKAWQPTAFAVYSADDGSLDFYKREFKNLPKAGDTFEGKAVTEIYTGFETETYSNQDIANDGSWYIQVPNTPWWSICKSVRSAKIVDNGIVPKSINYWFYNMSNMTSIDVSKLDTSHCTDFRMTFGCCESLTEIDVSSWSTDSLVALNGTFLGCRFMKSLNIGGWNTSKVESYHCLFHECCSLVGDAMQLAVDSLDVTDRASDFNLMFEGCTQLGSIDLSNWSFSGALSMWGMFSSCFKLQLDCSGWDVRSDTHHGDFNKNAPGVILPKAWQ